MLELLGLFFSGAAMGVIISYIVVVIAEWKFCKRNEEDIYEKLDEWSKHHKESHVKEE